HRIRPKLRVLDCFLPSLLLQNVVAKRGPLTWSVHRPYLVVKICRPFHCWMHVVDSNGFGPAKHPCQYRLLQVSEGEAHFCAVDIRWWICQHYSSTTFTGVLCEPPGSSFHIFGPPLFTFSMSWTIWAPTVEQWTHRTNQCLQP